MDDFYTILPSNSNETIFPSNKPNRYHVTWDNKPIKLCDIEHWKVALTELTYNHTSWSTRADFGVTLRNKCYTHILVKIQRLAINLSTGEYAYTPEKHTEHEHVEYHPLPQVKLDSEGHLVFMHKFRCHVENNDRMKEYNFIQTWHEKEKCWTARTSKPFEMTEAEKKDKMIIIMNFSLKLRSSKYIANETYYLREGLLFENIDQLVKLLSPFFSSCNLRIATDKNKQLKIMRKEAEVERGIFTEWKYVSEIYFLNGFHYILGFARPLLHLGKGWVVADFLPELYKAINHLHVYSNIVKPIQVGDSQVSLLRSLWLDSEDKFTRSESRTIIVRNPMYLPVHGSLINNISIEIFAEGGRLMPFNDNAITSVTLHFKKDKKCFN